MATHTDSCDSLPLHYIIAEVVSDKEAECKKNDVSSLSLSMEMSSSQVSFFDSTSNKEDAKTTTTTTNYQQRQSAMEQVRQDGVMDVAPRIPQKRCSLASVNLSKLLPPRSLEDYEGDEFKPARPYGCREDQNNREPSAVFASSSSQPGDGDCTFGVLYGWSALQSEGAFSTVCDSPPKMVSRADSISSLDELLAKSGDKDETETTAYSDDEQSVVLEIEPVSI